MKEKTRLVKNRGNWVTEQADALRTSVGDKSPVIFATGYGPSGLPHIGTFGEVVRTSMVRAAFAEKTSIKTRLLVFSDDMDALRKVPDNLPKTHMLEENLGRPLTAIPDPFGTHESFGAHNNDLLCQFLDKFGFEYEFQSATKLYQTGVYDDMLLRLLAKHQEVQEIVRPILGKERSINYSPFLPKCPETGMWLEASIEETHPEQGSLIYRHPHTDKLIETQVTGGQVKLQWRADWAMRWAAMDVAYEMLGKDLTDSRALAAKITRLLGKKPPLHYIYELFLDEKGEKISKSKGNGLTIEEWLRYAPHHSLSFFMYQHPRRAKKLYFDVIPRMTDDWLTSLKEYEHNQSPEHPAYLIHEGAVPTAPDCPSFSMMLNLASACNADHENILWQFLRRYDKKLQKGENKILDKLVSCAHLYYEDFVKPSKNYPIPTPQEISCLEKIKGYLAAASSDDALSLQQGLYDLSRECGYENTKEWFAMLYRQLLGQERGPRLGSFISFYGRDETLKLVDDALGRGTD